MFLVEVINMITYITEITFFDSIFRVALKLQRIPEKLLLKIKRQLNQVEHDLKSWEEKFSQSDNFFSDLERFYRAFFMWILQNNFSKLGQHEAIVSITCKKL